MQRLTLDKEKCIGCQACASVCSPGLISIADKGQRRTLRLATLCSEECDRCLQACPEAAITLGPAPKRLPATKYQTAQFTLLPCQHCGAPFTTKRIVDKLLVTVPKELGASPEELDWLGLCPVCRRAVQGENVVTKEAVRH